MSTSVSRPRPSGIELERRLYRKKQSARSVVISMISTVVFAVVVALIVSCIARPITEIPRPDRWAELEL